MSDERIPAPDSSSAGRHTTVNSNGEGTPRAGNPWVWVAGGVFVLVFIGAYNVMTPKGPTSNNTPEVASRPDPKNDQIAEQLLGQRESNPEQLSAVSDRAAMTPESLFAHCSPSVVQVVVQDRQGRTVGTGSGFLVSTTGLIATNYHVIEKAHSAHVALPDKTKVSVCVGCVWFWGADIAIIAIANRIDAQPLVLAGKDLPPVGAKVYAIGNPLGLANTLSDGLVSGHREHGQITEIQTTAPISPGSSGGPLLAADGRVVGVTTSAFRGGQNLNFAVPASHVARLLRETGFGVQLAQLPLLSQAEYLALVARGRTWLEKEEFDKAIQDFDEAIRLNPKKCEAFSERGFVWYLKRENDRAIKDLSEAIRLNPKYAPAYNNRGSVWKSMDENDKAIKDYSTAIQLGSKDVFSYVFRGDIWMEKKEYDKAIRDFDEVIQRSRAVPRAMGHVKRGNAWLAKKNYENAIKDYDEAISHWSMPLAYGNLAWLLATCPEAQMRDGKRAVKMATKACELTNWKSSEYLETLAAAYAEAGEYKEAVFHQTKALGVESTFYHGTKIDAHQRLELYKQKKPFRQSP